MTAPLAGDRCDEAASEGVGYTFLRRSYRRQGSTATAPGTEPGARRSEAPASRSISTASRDLVTVAALYVERDGAYYGLEGVDPWDEERDARLYDGPHPVVAHPPCNRWSIIAGQVETRYGYRRGDDAGCFAAALEAVRRCGGVLEHPAYSAAFAEFGLPIPMRLGGWVQSFLDEGWSAWVDQGWYGHPFKKPTWLYAHGVELPALRWGIGPGEQHPHRGTPYSETERKALTIPTPEPFRDLMLATARTAAVEREVSRV